jgi:hypothetical protein
MAAVRDVTGWRGGQASSPRPTTPICTLPLCRRSATCCVGSTCMCAPSTPRASLGTWTVRASSSAPRSARACVQLRPARRRRRGATKQLPSCGASWQLPSCGASWQGRPVPRSLTCHISCDRSPPSPFLLFLSPARSITRPPVPHATVIGRGV